MIKIDGKDVWLIDSHVHIWNKFAGLRYGDNPILTLGMGMASLQGKEYRFLPASFQDNQVPFEVMRGYMNDIGVDQVAILQNPCYGDQRDYVRDCMKSYPEYIVGSVGKMDPRKINNITKEIDTYINEYGFSGIKIEVPDTPFWMDDPEYDIMWKKLVDEDIMIIIDLGFRDTPYDFNIDRLEKVLRKYPTLRLRLAHIGISRLCGHNQVYPYPELQKTLDLFKINKDNLYMDVSGMPFFNPKDEYPDSRNVEILKVIYDTIGPDKLLWGTDFPTILNLRTMRQCLELITVQCNFLTFEDKVKILGQNLLNEFRIKK